MPTEVAKNDAYLRLKAAIERQNDAMRRDRATFCIQAWSTPPKDLVIPNASILRCLKVSIIANCLSQPPVFTYSFRKRALVRLGLDDSTLVETASNRNNQLNIDSNPDLGTSIYQ